MAVADDGLDDLLDRVRAKFPTSAVAVLAWRGPTWHALLPGAVSFDAANMLLKDSRAWVGWQAVGAQQAILDVLREYTLRREQFGKPLASFQMVQQAISGGPMPGESPTTGATDAATGTATRTSSPSRTATATQTSPGATPTSTTTTDGLVDVAQAC